MGILMKIHNVKNIKDFQFDIPIKRGLYAITGENGVGKSTIISCASTIFFIPSMKEYFGKPQAESYIEFYYNEKKRIIRSNENKWRSPTGFLPVDGFFEGSIVYGNRFKDIDFKTIKKLSQFEKSQLVDASDFVKKNLGEILHNDGKYYENLYMAKEENNLGLRRRPFFLLDGDTLVNQLNMSTGENLLITLLYSLKMKLDKKSKSKEHTIILLDEIELALHSSALRRLEFFLEKIAEDKGYVIVFSTHSIELIRNIRPENIFYLQRYADNSLEVVNPCYPVYATRNLESSNYGHDCIILVEDDLSKLIVDRILRDKRLLGNKKVMVIPVGGWTQVLRFAYDTIQSNLMLSVTKILIVLDRDIKSDVNGFLKSEKIGFSIEPHFLPIQSLEKFLLKYLVKETDHALFRELNDYIFQNKSLYEIVADYNQQIQYGNITREKRQNGKAFYALLKQELHQIRKREDELVEIVLDWIYNSKKEDMMELESFFESELK